MCDTVAVVTPEGVLFGKNSDREPSEAQAVEHVPAQDPGPGPRRCTGWEVPGAGRARAVFLSRPSWMWGAEMGANEDGVVAGNEAVFTRLPVAARGLTGMDLQRLALERASSAAQAVEVVIGLLADHPQGGRCSLRDAGFRYHSSFLFADAREAWVLETAGPLWAAERVRGVRTLSNVLSIGTPDRVHPDAEALARRRGWLRRDEPFGFARAFQRPLYRALTGGPERAACTRGLLEGAAADEAGLARLREALCSHAGRAPWSGLKVYMPCAHASWSPARTHGQTTGSLAALLRPGAARLLFTGTSAPCLSVFKPVSFDAAPGACGPMPTVDPEAESLWWRHEAVHRAVLQGYGPRSQVLRPLREALQAAVADATSPSDCADAWARHRDEAPAWLRAVRAAPAGDGPAAFRAYWRHQGALPAD